MHVLYMYVQFKFFIIFRRPGAVDLPLEGAVATGDTITLPEIFQNFESAVADLR